MIDRPSGVELLEAVRLFLDQELLPGLADPRLKYQTLIAINVLNIVQRELLLEDEWLREEWAWLSDSLETACELPAAKKEQLEAVAAATARLCKQIRAGEFDRPDLFQKLLTEIRVSVERKLAVANPRYLANFSS